MVEEIAIVGITKDTPKKDAVKFGECPKGRDCEQCSKLCECGSGALDDDDYEKIAKHLEISVDDLKKFYLEETEKFGTIRWRPKLMRKKDSDHQGRCIFYNDQEKCTIHGVKPMECRIATCTEYGDSLIEWFLLNYYVNPSNPQSVRDWAVRLKTHATIPGGEPHELIKDKKTLKKIMDYEILN